MKRDLNNFAWVLLIPMLVFLATFFCVHLAIPRTGQLQPQLPSVQPSVSMIKDVVVPVGSALLGALVPRFTIDAQVMRPPAN